MSVSLSPSDLSRPDHSEPLRQQTVLAKFGEFALKSDSLDQILTEACRLVGDALGTDLAKVTELQGNGTTLLVRAGIGWKPGVVGVVTIEAVASSTEEGRTGWRRSAQRSGSWRIGGRTITQARAGRVCGA